mmetsp:Transcript_127486/g.354919  ORF Transcript_127486/g.354919 Transcript_127486/m.354919 type:complete len:331 (-) Transcript_127486:462-1454(-)
MRCEEVVWAIFQEAQVLTEAHHPLVPVVQGQRRRHPQPEIARQARDVQLADQAGPPLPVGVLPIAARFDKLPQTVRLPRRIDALHHSDDQWKAFSQAASPRDFHADHRPHPRAQGDAQVTQAIFKRAAAIVPSALELPQRRHNGCSDRLGLNLCLCANRWGGHGHAQLCTVIGKVGICLRQLPSVPHEQLGLEPQPASFHVSIRGIEGVDHRLEGLQVSRHAELAENGRVHLAAQEARHQHHVPHIVALGFPLDVVELPLVLRLDEEGLHHPVRRSALSHRQARVERIRPARKVRKHHLTRHSLRVPERYCAMRPRLHDTDMLDKNRVQD